MSQDVYQVNGFLVVIKSHITLNKKEHVAFSLAWDSAHSLNEKVSALDDFLKSESLPFNHNKRKYLLTDRLMENEPELQIIFINHGWRPLQTHDGFWKNQERTQK